MLFNVVFGLRQPPGYCCGVWVAEGRARPPQAFALVAAALATIGYPVGG